MLTKQSDKRELDGNAKEIMTTSSQVQLAVLGSWIRIKHITQVADEKHSYSWSNHVDGTGSHGVHTDYS